MDFPLPSYEYDNGKKYIFDVFTKAGNSYLRVYSSEGKDVIEYSDEDVDHYQHEIKITLKYDSKTAYKTVVVNSIKLNELTGKSPFAVYFAIGSLGNYTSTHSINNLFITIVIIISLFKQQIY